MKYKLILFFLSILIGNKICVGQDSSYVKSPEPSKKKLKERLTLGGNIGLSFGDVTFINLSPRIGYRITDKLTTGLGLTYQYIQDNRFDPDFKSSIYGGSIFSTFSIIDEIFLQTEFELLNVENRFSPFESNSRVFVPVWLVGGGYRLSIGGRSFLNMTLLYDLIQDVNSPYSNKLIVRGGIGIGL